MEKYNIPEQNSLDSIEGVENLNFNQENNIEISPEIEKMVMDKVGDILDDGKAYHVLRRQMFFNSESNKKAPSFINRIPKKVPDSRIGGPKNSKIDDNKSIQEITVDNIKEYFKNEMLTEDDIEKFFTYGIITNYPRREYSEEGKMNLPDNYESYRELIKSAKQELEEPIGQNASYVGTLYFTIQGREGKNKQDALKNWRRGNSGLTFVFRHPNEEIFNLGVDNKGDLIRNRKLKFGQFSTSHYSNYDDILSKWLVEYPDLKPDDPRIGELVKRDGLSEHGYFNENNQTLGRHEGFILPFRISPKRYEGLIVSFDGVIYYEDIVEVGESEISDQELFDRFIRFNKSLQDGDQNAINKHFRNQINRTVRVMLESCKENPERIVPLYDNEGNLLWPQNITYEEIVKTKEGK